jgi:hypothetical protein
VEIKNHVDIDNNFDFQNITAERVEKIINNGDHFLCVWELPELLSKSLEIHQCL